MTVLAPGALLLGLVGVEDHLAHGRARGRAQAGGEDGVGSFGIKARVQQLVELAGIDPLQRLLLGDETLSDHVRRDLHGRRRGALAVAGLQHVELAVLDGELHVLHVPIVLLQGLADGVELLQGMRHDVAHLFQGAGVTDAGHHVLALGVHQELAVEEVLAGGGVAGEGHAGAGGLALVAEDHGLHVDRRAQIVRDALGAPVDLGPVVVPALEHGHDGHVQLLERIGGKLLAGVIAQDLLEANGEVAQVVGGKVGIEGGAHFLSSCR